MDTIARVYLGAASRRPSAPANPWPSDWAAVSVEDITHAKR